MRLRTIKNELEGIIPELYYEATQRNTNPQTYQFNTVALLKEALERLDELDLFQKQIEQLKKLSFYDYSGDKLIVDLNQHRTLLKLIPELKNSAEGLYDSISKSISKEEANIISIKIPPPNNFEDLEETSNKLNKIFSQVLYNETVQGKIQIINFDTGSYWIDILVTGVRVLEVIGGVAYGGAIVFKKLQEGRLVQQQVKEMQISNKALEEIQEKSKESVNQVAKSEADFIYNTFFEGKDNEQAERIKFALKELAELYYNGGEIHPSLEAPKNVKKEFPDYNNLEANKSKIKQIKGKK
ncbi:hypothetical protein [Christiangramia echinicola]|uniref:Uncharacterized protein n=1 Tax=Christiangramia echinicola TaxID=279359 RepID=A0A1H1KUY4_9FLAO|nr:hypothetical protein [Christiangramia echinicola]SDR66103.1 hypothetical protein SAMN04488552_0241 [Christiangramia echinicola]